jgi:NitT/TauT family transport system permease protein
MRIGQPLSRRWRSLLGVISIIALLLVYGGLAQQRQMAKRRAASELLRQAQAELQETQRSLAQDPAQAVDDPDLVQPDPKLRERLQQQSRLVERLTREMRSGEDRSVPTWTALYRDGFLRVVRAEGLSRNEYWLWEDATASLRRLFAGLTLGVVLSVLIGLLMGCFSVVDALLLPPFSFLAKIPPTAMLAVFFVLVGTGFEMYLAMLAFGTLPTLAQTVSQSVKSDVPEELIFKASTLGATQLELIWNVIFRQILPRLLDAIRLQVGPAMVLLVAAECIIAGAGFGYRLRLFFQRTDMTVVFVYLLVLGLIGLVLDTALIWLRRWLCPWFGE